MIRKEKVCYFRFILFLNRFKKSNVEQKIFNIQITNRYSHNGFKVVTKSLNIPILFSNNYQGKYWFRNKHENGIMHCMHWLKDHTRPGEGEGAVFDPLTWPFWKGLTSQGQGNILRKYCFLCKYFEVDIIDKFSVEIQSSDQMNNARELQFMTIIRNILFSIITKKQM